MSDVLLGVIIAGGMSTVGNLLLFLLQWVMQTRKERREEKIKYSKYLNDFRMNLRLKQTELLTNASYIINLNEYSNDRYLKFLDSQIYLESYYLHNNGEFGVYLTVRIAIEKLGELVVSFINENETENKKKLKELIVDCVKYLQAYFNKIAEGFQIETKNITEYCYGLYENPYLVKIEEKLGFPRY